MEAMSAAGRCVGALAGAGVVAGKAREGPLPVAAGALAARLAAGATGPPPGPALEDAAEDGAVVPGPAGAVGVGSVRGVGVGPDPAGAVALVDGAAAELAAVDGAAGAAGLPGELALALGAAFVVGADA